MKIGVFDSGLGGLAILKQFLKRLPQYDYIYLGDSARLPYGGRSNEVIYEFTLQAVDYLFKNNCALIILACNAATGAALRRLQREYLPKHYPDRRILGVIRPAVEEALDNGIKKVGVIATYATVKTESFPKELKKLKGEIEVVQQACPLLVPIIEEGEIEWEGLISILQKYLSPIKKSRVDALILGCTHYELIADKIKTQVDGIKVISEGKVTADKLLDYLTRHPEIAEKLTHSKTRTYLFTDFNERYKKMADMFLDKHLQTNDKMTHVHLPQVELEYNT